MARKRKSRRSPGEGSVYLRADTGKYEGAIVVGYTPAGNPRRVKKSFVLKSDAVAWLADQKLALSQGARLDSKATLSEVYEEWISAGETLGGWEAATVENYKSIVKSHILPSLGRVKVRDIAPADVRSLLKRLSKGGMSPNGVRRVRSYLSMLLLDAKRMGLVLFNAAADVPAPAKVKTVVQRWTEEEVGRVIRQCHAQDDQVARYVRVALGTGMRPEELLGLTWAAVNLENQSLEVRQVATEVKGKAALRHGGKNDNAERPVVFDSHTAQALQRQREYVDELQRIRVELNVKREKVGKAPLPWADLDLVFPSSLGTVWGRTVLRREFDKLQAAAEVTRIQLKATRATHISVLADNDANLLAMRQRVGHSRLQHTEPYLRGSEAAQRTLAELIGSILGVDSRGSSGAEGSNKRVTRAAESGSRDALGPS